MSVKKINTSRRKVVLGSVSLGAVGGALPQKWSAPLVGAVVSPAHAQTSPTVTAIPVCPALTINNIFLSQLILLSIRTGDCGIFFDILSSDPDQPLNVISIADDSSENVGVFFLTAPPGLVTDTDGITVGVTVAASECSSGLSGIAATVFEDVTFTIDAECDNGGEPVQLVVSLSDLPEVSIAASPIECATLLVTNVSFSPSASGECLITFEIVSSDPFQDLAFDSITNDASVNVDVNVVNVPSGGIVSSFESIAVEVVGLASDCSATSATIFEDVTFTVDATCVNNANFGDSAQLVVSLSDLEGVTIVAPA